MGAFRRHYAEHQAGVARVAARKARRTEEQPPLDGKMRGPGAQPWHPLQPSLTRHDVQEKAQHVSQGL